MKVLNVRLLAATAALVLAAPMASAGTLDINLDGIESFGFQGDAGNTVLTFDIGAGSTITDISWDLTLTPVSPSWGEEAIIGISTDSDVANLQFFAGASNSDPVASSGTSPLVLASGDGIVSIEFYEIDFDDILGGADAIWGGELSIDFETSVVPVPAAVWLLGSGLLGLLGLRRRA